MVKGFRDWKLKLRGAFQLDWVVGALVGLELIKLVDASSSEKY